MKNQHETFESLMSSFLHHHDLKTVFDDFLTLTLCALARNPLTGESYEKDLYTETRDKYKGDSLGDLFPIMFGKIIWEMQRRITSADGSDVLGEYYEVHFLEKNSGGPFRSWVNCIGIARAIAHDMEIKNVIKFQALDESCGSGRLLLALGKVIGTAHTFFGVDTDHTCVKMAALNLFLNSQFDSEVMWSKSLTPPAFSLSYQLKTSPLGVFRVSEKELSPLWSCYTENGESVSAHKDTV